MPNCSIIENHACITVNGYWRPCCRFNEAVQPWNDRMAVNHTTYSEYKNSPFFQQIKSDLQTGWHEGCLGCKVAEDTGNASTRLIFNDKLSGIKDQVEYIEISLSNECNLACKMCGPYASSLWNQIAIDNEDIHDFLKPSKTVEPIDVKKVFGTMNLTHLKTIKLLGGEPFITPQTYDFFEYLDHIGLIDKVIIMTNTNATFFPKKMIKFLEKFKAINLGISIDGIGEVNDYVRYKSDWNTFNKVVDDWLDFFKDRHDRSALGFTSVINVYNVHQIIELHEYAKSKNVRFLFNIINGPKQLCLQALPKQYVDMLLDKYADNDYAQTTHKYLSMITLDTDLQNKLKRFTKQIDSITGMNLYTVNNILAKELGL